MTTADLTDAAWWEEVSEGINPVQREMNFAAATSMHYLDRAFNELKHMPIKNVASALVILQALQRLQGRAKEYLADERAEAAQ